MAGSIVGDLRPGEPACTLCAAQPPLFHVHHDGRVPQMPCPACTEGRHGDCTPEPYWCGCQRLDCIGARP